MQKSYFVLRGLNTKDSDFQKHTYSSVALCNAALAFANNQFMEEGRLGTYTLRDGQFSFCRLFDGSSSSQASSKENLDDVETHLNGS